MRLVNTSALLLALGLAACSSSDYTQDTDAAPQVGPGLTDAGTPDVRTDTTPPHAYGEFCLEDAQCGSGLCYLQHCSRACAANLPNDCRDVDAFCVAVGGDKTGCFGHVETGNDV